MKYGCLVRPRYFQNVNNNFFIFKLTHFKIGNFFPDTACEKKTFFQNSWRKPITRDSECSPSIVSNNLSLTRKYLREIQFKNN